MDHKQTLPAVLTWGAPACALIVLALVGVWVHGLGGVANGPTATPTGYSTSLLFNWHPILMTMGFAVFMSQAIVAYKNPVLGRLQRSTRKVVHWTCHSLALLCVALGLLVVFQSHNLSTPPIPNLYSVHSALGIFTATLFFAQFAVGLLCYLWPKASLQRRESLAPWHGVVGVVVFVLGLSTAMVGLQEKATFLQAYGKAEVYSSAMRLPQISALFIVALAVLTVVQIRPMASLEKSEAELLLENAGGTAR